MALTPPQLKTSEFSHSPSLPCQTRRLAHVLNVEAPRKEVPSLILGSVSRPADISSQTGVGDALPPWTSQ